MQRAWKIPTSNGPKWVARGVSGHATRLCDSESEALGLAKAIDEAIAAGQEPETSMLAQDVTPDSIRRIGARIWQVGDCAFLLQDPRGEVAEYLFASLVEALAGVKVASAKSPASQAKP